MVKIYGYKKCSTCQQALKFLSSQNIEFTELPIIDQPPTRAELKLMLKCLELSGGSLKNLFNTSGEQYRSLEISQKLKAGLSEAEALGLLASNGKLIKRPFVLAGQRGLVGFNPDIWKKWISGL